MKRSIAWAGCRIPAPASDAPIVLLYHGTPRNTKPGRVDEAAFAAQIGMLKRNCELIGPETATLSRRGGRPRVLLTFDDGFRNNYDVARPILQEHNAPAVFFITSRHNTRGKYLWFAHLRALEDYFPHPAIRFRGESFSMSAERRGSSMQRLKTLLLSLTPHPRAMYEAIEDELPRLEDFLPPERIDDTCAGMTAAQVRELAADPLFTIGGHTVDHPFLGRCEPEEAERQISENKQWLEQAAERRIETFAYPSGEYNSDIISGCKRAEFRQAYAVIPVQQVAGPYDIGRIGIYGTSLVALSFIVRWGNTLRAKRVRLG
ncbi:MAG TPA: polysaccharide deacetylase family protein [Bryobacteraceae bacterium]|nr:polysaccharide deacetylase family protein [Bryobacteraceae bacterium]